MGGTKEYSIPDDIDSLTEFVIKLKELVENDNK
jgi:hypothetical protein